MVTAHTTTHRSTILTGTGDSMILGITQAIHSAGAGVACIGIGDSIALGTILTSILHSTTITTTITTITMLTIITILVIVITIALAQAATALWQAIVQVVTQAHTLTMA